MYVAKFLELLDLDNLETLDNVTYDTLFGWMEEGLDLFMDTLQTTYVNLTEFEAAGGMLHRITCQRRQGD